MNCSFFIFLSTLSPDTETVIEHRGKDIYIYRIRYNIKLSLFPSRGSQQRPESVEAPISRGGNQQRLKSEEARVSRGSNQQRPASAEAAVSRGRSQQRPESTEAGQKKATTQTT